MDKSSPRSWDQLIEIEAEKVAKRSYDKLSEQLTECQTAALELGARIEPMLNNPTCGEWRNGIRVDVVRVDAKQREWEATFSAVNMSGPQIVRLTCLGYYIQAVALLRQELEGVAQLEHILMYSRTDKKAPNVGHLGEELRRIYNMLSTGAHIGTDEMASIQAPQFPDSRQLAMTPHGISLLPVFNEEVAASLLNAHVLIRRKLCGELGKHLTRNGIA